MSDASSKQPVIPADWDAKPLSWAISGLRAGVSVNSDPEAKVTDGRPSVLKTSAIFAGRLNLQERKPIIPKDLGRARCSLQAGTILISRMNTPALVGECGYVATDEPDVFLPDRIWMTEFNANRGTNSRWLASVLSSSTMRSRLKEIATGTSGSMKNIAKGALLSQEILFPPPEEQEAIGEALSDADALIEGLERLIAKKRLIKQGAMQDLVTAKRRLPGFSGEWSPMTLFEMADSNKKNFDDGDWIEAEHIATTGMRLIQTGNVGIGTFLPSNRKYIHPESFRKLRCKEVHPGDVLICRLADPPGRACIVPDLGEEKMLTSVDVTIYRPNGLIADRKLLTEFMSQSEWFTRVDEASGGTTRKRIARSQLGRLTLLMPPLKEQEALSELCSDMDAEIQALDTRLEKARQLKEGMMQNLLTGRIRLV